MDRIAGIVIPGALLVLFSALLAWGGLGFDHAVCTRWVTVVDNPHTYLQKARGTYHHGRAAILIVSMALGVAWVVICTIGVSFMRWAWRGYPA